MAVYFLNLKTFGRANNSSAVSAAAYRAGERIRDERTGKTYDHSERRDVLHKEIVLPSELAGDNVSWALDRANLWNAAEHAETRKNARVAREYLVALPAELSDEQRLVLTRGFAHELSDRYRFALDVAIHATIPAAIRAIFTPICWRRPAKFRCTGSAPRRPWNGMMATAATSAWGRRWESCST